MHACGLHVYLYANIVYEQHNVKSNLSHTFRDTHSVSPKMFNQCHYIPFLTMKSPEDAASELVQVYKTNTNVGIP